MKYGILCNILIQKQRHYSVILNSVSAKWGRKLGRLYQYDYQVKGKGNFYRHVTLPNYNWARSKLEKSFLSVTPLPHLPWPFCV